MRRPIVRADLIVETLGSEVVLLRSETEAHWLEGLAYPLIVPLLDGRPVDQIADALAGVLDVETLHYTLTVLEKRGLLQDAATRTSNPGFWRNLSADPVVACARLGAARIEVRSLDGDETIERLLSDALRAWDVQVEAGGDVLIVLVSDYRDVRLAAVNQEARHAGRPWLLVNLSARRVMIGPAFRPGPESACWACLEHRLRENRLTAPVTGDGDQLRTLAVQFATTELIKWIGCSGSRLDAGILTLDPGTFGVRHHVVHRRPQCHVCGNPEVATSFGRIALQSQRTTHFADGGYRTRSPEDTAALLERQVSPLTGIVPEVWRQSTEGPAVFATRLNGPSGSVFHGEALAGRPLSAAGKGMSPSQSRAGCLAEAVERYSACFQGDEPRITASASDLGPAAVVPDSLLLFSPRQYQDRETWNRQRGRQHAVPEPYACDTPLHWVTSWSITHDAVRYLPAGYCFIDYAEAHDMRFSTGDSNGCAAGNTIEEAILQGFLELAERDALAMWWRNRVVRPSRDIENFEESSLRESATAIRAMGRTLRVFDLTHDLEIPVFAAMSATIDGNDIAVGSGAHLDPRLALTRAIAEVHQSLAWPRESDRVPISLASMPHLAASTDLEWPRCTPQRTMDLRDDVHRCVDAARRRGLDVIVTNLTRADIGFPVVRVTVPGLRHYKPRFGPGRLYDVPVEIGWLDTPLREEEINQEPLPL